MKLVFHSYIVEEVYPASSFRSLREEKSSNLSNLRGNSETEGLFLTQKDGQKQRVELNLSSFSCNFHDGPNKNSALSHKNDVRKIMLLNTEK